jgi:hypothetical protein
MRAKGTMGRYRYREREGMSERGEGEGRERCDFLIPLHDKRDTDQVVALAYFYVGG